MAKPVFDSLMKTGKVVRGYLGIAIQDLTSDLAASFNLKETRGVLVSDVTEDSPAERSGLKQGDIIRMFDGKPVEDPAALQRAVARTSIGAKVPVTIVRDGREQEIAVTVGEQVEATKTAARTEDGEASHALAGIEVQPLDRETARELRLSEKTKGVIVSSIEPDSAAAAAGLAEGDVILEVNRHQVRTVKDFEKATSELKKDQSVLLRINRRGASIYLSVKI
jgi:serine protease Do